MALSRSSRRSLTISGVLFVVFLLSSLFRPLCELAVAAPIGSPPNGARVLQPGQLPVVCTEADGTVNLSGATYGAYWSESAQAWISAPYCYARWGYLQASASQIVAAGATVTVTATPDDGRMAGFVAVQGGMSWSYPGTRISGCGTTDMSCTVKIGDEDAPPAEWTWHQFHVSGPGRVFILPPSYAPRCQAAAPCLDTYTNAWSYVGVTPEDNCTVSPQSALQSGSGEQGLTTLQAQACKILGLTWEMPGGKDTQYSNSWATIDGVIPAAEVQKQKFEVDLILKIFDKHAESAEAKLQIELASIKHMGPRIFGMGMELSKQG